ncbi:hypothetical protein QT327_16405 [Olivibacter sp. 47]|uniref:hypothetical protein n=1 Tax=Olivibacter sp. 47 TaxID=3056486 RepID=UPI0025A44DC5|nr:hypothetical protein [Olivibacter sp. 47]MDM8175910.1 hypothetical protein [Olivibacter sp. 47]
MKLNLLVPKNMIFPQFDLLKNENENKLEFEINSIGRLPLELKVLTTLNYSD